MLFIIYWTLYTSNLLYKITKVEYFNYDAKQKAKKEQLKQESASEPEAMLILKSTDFKA